MAICNSKSFCEKVGVTPLSLFPEDPYAFEITSLQSEDEDQFLVFGQIDNKNYTAIITYRNSNIRIF